MKKEKKSPRPKFWLFRIITYIYLPLTIALNIYIAMGNVYSIGRLKFVSVFSYIEAVELMMPFVTAFLFTLSLIGLLGLTSFGQRCMLFSTFLRNLIFFVLIAASLLDKDVKSACYYAPACLLGMLIYLYFKHRDYIFIKGGQSIKEAKAKLRKAEEEKKIKAEAAECIAEVKAEKEEAKAEEDSADITEEKEGVKTTSSFTLHGIEGDYPLTDLVKKRKFIYAFPDTGTPVMVISSTFSIFPTKTIIEIEVDNTADEVYSSSTWTIGEAQFTSGETIKPGKNKVTIMVEPVLEEAAVKLQSVKSAL